MATRKTDEIKEDGAFAELEKAPEGVGAEQIQKNVDEAEAQGFIGVKTDPRPNSDYSLEGGAPGVK